ncbi:hypothetical protein H0H92_002175 [Tricholoma furcatifolium]|nr:hypothetical protein H0H92_002175 [Tricholoma furcatifolium]
MALTQGRAKSTSDVRVMNPVHESSLPVPSQDGDNIELVAQPFLATGFPSKTSIAAANDEEVQGEPKVYAFDLPLEAVA